MSARKRLYKYISLHGIRAYSSAELREVGKIDDWARSLRQLRQDGIINYDFQNLNYEIFEINDYKETSKRRGLSSKDRYRIRNRDGHRCQACGKGAEDKVILHVDHKVPLEWGGTNEDDNLWVLCDYCNHGKKAHYADDFDPEIMKKVVSQPSGYQKLKVLFEESPNKKFMPSILQGISGIRDWTRTIRDIRKKHNLNIVWFPKTTEFPNGYYSNVQE